WRSDGANQQMGSCCAATVSRRPRGVLDCRRDRSQGHPGADRTHRHLDSRRMAGTVGDRVGRAVRGSHPQRIRLRGRRGDHAWRDTRRAAADRSDLSSDLIGRGMSQYLKDKVIIVTGAASGFGKLISEECAAGGAKGVGVDVSVEGLNEVFGGIQAAGFEGTAHVADVTDMAQVQAASQHAVDTYGRIDVIVNNAGVMPLAFFADHERAWEKWHKAIDINIKGVVNGVSAVYDTMIKQGRGQVVNISSIYGNAGTEGSGVYSATKAAVDVLSDSLRVEAQGRIKVTTVKPTGVLGTNL